MADVQVTVETPSENQIIAVEFDGREIIQPPLTLAEHFAKQASRLDFNEIEDERETDPDTTAEEDQEEDENNTGFTGKRSVPYLGYQYYKPKNLGAPKNISDHNPYVL